MDTSTNYSPPASDESPNRKAVPVPAVVLPFRKSIWRKTTDYQFGGCSQEEFKVLSQLYDVISAKLQIAFPNLADSVALASAIDSLPDDPATAESSELETAIKAFLIRALRLRGIGIAVAVCALAVLKGGRYAPIDRKVVGGLLNLGIVTAIDAKALLRNDVTEFARVYAFTVLPEWRKETQRRTPEQADAFWASHA
ncbi:hypothetical protein [Paraburkholderia sp. J8-2]|uniref:hypothetical protein n=1 Tax=Paraburkholderia sp. J8-2 TaxID=2805440 RepID=UPI002AB5FBAD|nr:hypothetical protein [Paraburkholderia sp. J8-2]